MTYPSLPEDLLDVIGSIDSREDLNRLFSDLFTPSETESLRERWAIVKLLASGQNQRAVSSAIGVSITTVNRGNRQLKYGTDGFAIAFQLLDSLGYGDPREAEQP
jgi:TrpR-related protein YerC/YecD